MTEPMRIWRGGVYEVKSRNLIVAAYDGEEGFIGIREKFGERFLATEYLAREQGGTKQPYDTVMPIAFIATLDESIEIVDNLPGSTCDTCGNEAWFVQDPQVQSGRTWGWWECEGKCYVDGQTRSRAKGNPLLFEILCELEGPVRERLATEFPPVAPIERE